MPLLAVPHCAFAQLREWLSACERGETSSIEDVCADPSVPPEWRDELRRAIERQVATAIPQTDDGPPPVVRPAAAEWPAHIGRFRIEGVLSHGAYGCVLRAVDGEFQRTVAIKVPRRDRRLRSADVSEYLNEARNLAALDHPHIVTVHETGRSDEAPCYVVSKFMAGRRERGSQTTPIVAPPTAPPDVDAGGPDAHVEFLRIRTQGGRHRVRSQRYVRRPFEADLISSAVPDCVVSGCHRSAEPSRTAHGSCSGDLLKRLQHRQPLRQRHRAGQPRPQLPVHMHPEGADAAGGLVGVADRESALVTTPACRRPGYPASGR